MSRPASPDFSRRVATRFGAAAARYDAHSAAQRHAAQRLAAHIATIITPVPHSPAGPARQRVLEIGCGTGHLTAWLVRQRPNAQILVTDIAPAMVAACRARLGQNPGLAFAALDGAHPAVAGPFDLICASLAAQWFTDLPGALAQLAALLAPGGLLALCLPGAATFGEWRAAHTRLGLSAGTLALPSVATCRAALPAGGSARIEMEYWLDRPPGGIDFLRSLRAIGADTPVPGHVPLSPVRLRHVLRELGPAPTLTYELIYLLWQRDTLA